MINNTSKKHLIIAVIFLAVIFIIGGMTVARNYKSILTSVYDKYKSSDTNFVDKLILTFEQAIKSSNSAFSSGVAAQRYFIEGYGAVQRLLNKKIIEDADIGFILKDEQGTLHFPAYKYNMYKTSDKLVGINNYLKDINMPFSFIMALSKDYERYTTFKKGVDIYANSNLNSNIFLGELDKGKVNYLDLRQSAYKSNLDIGNTFFKTDHHWNTETAFWAFKEIVDYIKDTYGIELDENNYYTNIENYNSEKFENSFLGSLGKRMGEIYSGIDDYTLIVPNFETNMKLYQGFYKELIKEGSFESTIIDKDLCDVDKPVTTNRYASYFSLDNDFNTIINENASNDYKIVMIKDSYALPVAAFLSLVCKEITIIDFRLSKDQSVKDFIKNNDYDLCLMLYGSGSICNDNMFDLK